MSDVWDDDPLAGPPDALVASGGLAMPAGPVPYILAGHDRPLMDALPRMCGRHHPPALIKGLTFSCVACRRTYRAKMKRPYRSGGYSCMECNQYVPKGPKLPKVLTWVEVNDSWLLGEIIAAAKYEITEFGEDEHGIYMRARPS